MSVLLTNTFEGGTAGADVTAGSSGGASGTALDVSKGANSSVKYVAGGFHGALGVEFTAAAGESAFLQWAPAGEAQDSYAIRAYLRPGTPPPLATGGTDFLGQIRGTAGTMATVGLSGDSRFRVLAADGSTLGTATSARLAGTTYRWELRVTRGTTTSNGRVDFAYYAGDSTAPIQTMSFPTTNTTTGQATHARFGRGASNTVA